MSAEHDETLQRSSFFRFLPEGTYERIRGLLREEQYEFGEVIVRQGDEADAYFVLTSGRARVVKESAQGNELALTTLRPGDEFGELALISGGSRMATVRCSTAVSVLRLNRCDFLPLLAEYPDLRKSLELTARFRTLHGFLYEFSGFGRLPCAGLARAHRKAGARNFCEGRIDHSRGRPCGSDVHRGERPRSCLCEARWSRA
jgi:ATP-binding cassette subfamily B protein